MATEKVDPRGIAAREQIMNHIASNDGVTVYEMSDALGRKPKNLQFHLQQMARDGVVHSTSVTNKGRGGWHIGPSTTPRCKEVNRPTPKTWQPHHVRDALVSALFGEPQRVAA